MATRDEESVSKLGVDFAGSPDTHAFLAPAVATGFQFLRIAAALRDRAGEWHALHSPVDPIELELANGKGIERAAYNDRSLQRLFSRGEPVLSTHAGFWDFFFPIGAAKAPDAALITGPFAVRRPTSAAIKERWRWLTGRAPSLSDPQFARYLDRSLDLLTLDRTHVRYFRRWVECLADLISGRGNARAIGMRAALLLSKLEETRFADRMWESARRMIDERTARSWLSQQVADDMARIRLKQLPERALVALAARAPGQADPVRERIRRDAFQRACVDLAVTANAACGRVADHGVVFLVAAPRSSERFKEAMTKLGEKAKELARRRFGFELHLGESSMRGTSHLIDHYAEALDAAERAVSKGVSAQHTDSVSGSTASALRDLRRRLAAWSEERPSALLPRFERYMEAVSLRCGSELELARVHLETGFDQVAQALLGSGLLAEKTYLDMRTRLDRMANAAATVEALFDAYRYFLGQLVEFAEQPLAATQASSLRRATEFIRSHLTERLRLAQVARVAGFAPSHFAELFKRSEGTTFNRYVTQVRIERAKELLQGTDLSADRISQLSGFPLRHYFHRVFKSALGMTPMDYRKSRPQSRRRTHEPSRARSRRH